MMVVLVKKKKKEKKKTVWVGKGIGQMKEVHVAFLPG